MKAVAWFSILFLGFALQAGCASPGRSEAIVCPPDGGTSGERLFVERQAGIVRLISSRTGELERFSEVKTDVRLEAAGRGPWTGRDDDGRTVRVTAVACAAKLVFAEESALLYWRGKEGIWRRIWLAD